MELPSEVISFLGDHEGLFEKLENGKIRCVLTGHELPAKIDALSAHTRGKRFQTARLSTSIKIPDQFKEFLVPHRKEPGKLYCVLTGRSINRRQEEVMRHLGGVRFFKRYDDHMRKMEQQQNGDGHVKEVAMQEEVRGGDSTNDNDMGEEELWVPPEYSKMEKSATSKGEQSMSESSEEEGEESEDDMEVEAVIRTVLVKAPRSGKGKSSKSRDQIDDSADNMDMTGSSEDDEDSAQVTNVAAKRKPERSLKSKAHAETRKRAKPLK